ncbi:hypothetical protein J3Q64DRAFT_1833240 [Phycomyces blakesleeanus]|uniref:HNH nuclease domain-containing protein n=1 Tax=Phycomyces blakesleeanus TaxID=4837 RepID=A0ABR3B2V3_PHYBL
MSKSLECRVVHQTGSILVAHYLPRELKNEYFGLLSILNQNIRHCGLWDYPELEHVLVMSLLTILDKSNDSRWKKDPIGKADDWMMDHNGQTSLNKPISEKDKRKKMKVAKENEGLLKAMLKKDLIRSNSQFEKNAAKYPTDAFGNLTDRARAATSTSMQLAPLSPRSRASSLSYTNRITAESEVTRARIGNALGNLKTTDATATLPTFQTPYESHSPNLQALFQPPPSPSDYFSQRLSSRVNMPLNGNLLHQHHERLLHTPERSQSTKSHNTSSSLTHRRTASTDHHSHRVAPGYVDEASLSRFVLNSTTQKLILKHCTETL